MLCTQQCALRNIEFGAMQFNLLTLLSSAICGDEWLRSLECVDIPPEIGSINDLFAYQSILQRAPKLSTLAIRTATAIDTLPRELQDSQQQNGLLAETLFSHIPKHGPCKLELEELLLEDVSLTYAQRTFAKLIDFGRLRHLSLYSCEGWDRLLLHLTASFRANGAKLVKFFASSDDVQVTVVEDFLKSFKGLEILYLRSRSAPSSFDCACLIGHAKTLRTLAISLGEVRGPRSSGALVMDPYRTVASEQCRQLTDFGVAMPFISLPQGLSGEWKDYGQALKSLMKLPELEVLRIFTLPEASAEFWFDFTTQDARQYMHVRESYLHELDNFATELMRFMEKFKARRNLPIICFGNIGWTGIFHGGSYLSLQSICYVPSMQTDVFGSERTVAVRTSTIQARYTSCYHVLLDDHYTSWVLSA